MVLEWQPNKKDLIFSFVIALVFPILAGLIYDKIGALVPMIMYYSLAWGIVLWRRGKSGYVKKLSGDPPTFFYINVVLIIVCLILGYQSRITDTGSNLGGLLFTLIIWTPLNAASEQLLWIYIYESWDLHSFGKNPNEEKHNSSLIGKIIGLLLFLIFVGTIHVLFWVKFLHVVESSTVYGGLFVILVSFSGFIHILVWKKSNNMIYTFIPHFLLNFITTLFTSYSMVPYLF